MADRPKLGEAGHPSLRNMPKGYLNPRVVNGVALSIITLCIVVGVTSSIMAIWEYADKDTLWRTIGTVGVVVLGTVMFAGVNKALGD